MATETRATGGIASPSDRFPQSHDMVDQVLHDDDESSDGSGPSGMNDTEIELARLRAENLDLAHRILTLRDHAIGCEAEVAQAGFEAELARRDLAVLRVAASASDDALRRARHEIRELRESSSWRIGRMVVAPVARIRGKDQARDRRRTRG